MLLDESRYLENLRMELPGAKRVLVLAPHPDDEVIGCGGSLALLRDKGADIQVVIATNGELGAQVADAGLSRIRAEESRRAGALLYRGAPVFWNYPDRGLVYGEELIERIVAQVNDNGADLVFLPSPTEIHPDHQSLALAGAEAARRLGGDIHVVFYEVGAPLPTPNLLIDITSVQERKKNALECFDSQLKEHPYAERTIGLNLFRASYMGKESKSAEAFVLAHSSLLTRSLAGLFAGLPAYRRKLGFAASPEDIPLVSIVVRSMDRPTLAEALDSLALQTYGHVEVVVVNAKGGKHSPLGEWCGHFPLRLVNQGGEPLSRSRAANVGLKSCLGIYLGFLDDDDTLIPGHVHQRVELLNAASREAVAFEGISSGWYRGEAGQATPDGYKNDENGFPRLLLGGLVPSKAGLFSASLLKSGLAFDEDLPMGEDWDFWLRAARLASPVFGHSSLASEKAFPGRGSLEVPGEPVSSKVAERVCEKWLPLLGPNGLISLVNYHRRVCFGLESRLKETIRCLSATEDRLTETQNLLRDTEERLRDTEERLGGAETSMRRLGRDLAERQRFLETILASRSWRLTHPLRLFNEFLHRLRHS